LKSKQRTMKIPCLLISSFFIETNASNLRFKETDAVTSFLERHGDRNLAMERGDETMLEIKVKDAACNFQNLEAACITEYDEELCDVASLFGVRTEEKAGHKVDRLCAKAFDASNRSKGRNAGAIAFQDVTGQGYQFDNEYYDGGTKLNAEYEPVKIETSAGFSIKDFHDRAKTNLVEFPEEYLEDNFGRCKAQSVMCCWVQDRQANDGNGNCEDDDCGDADPMDNTDICYNDLREAPLSNHVTGGFSIYENDVEGETHCHGFAWPNDIEDANHRYRGNLLFFVSMLDHLDTRGYAREVPGAPMCSCIEKMPVVSRSDCTEVVVSETYKFTFNLSAPHLNEAELTDIDVEFIACNGETNNDLRSRFDKLDGDGMVDSSAKTYFDEHIVGDCDDKYEEFLNSMGYTKN